MRTIIISLIILSFVSCGTKKRVINIDKGAEIAIERKNVVSEGASSVINTDTSKIKTKTSEDTYVKVVEKWVWSETGDPVAYTKTTINKGNVATETEELKGVTSERRDSSKTTDLSIVSNEKTHEVVVDTLDRDNPPPVFLKGWWWVMLIGGAIVLGVMWLFARR